LTQNVALLGDIALLSIINEGREMGRKLLADTVGLDREESALVERVEHPLRLNVFARGDEGSESRTINDLESNLESNLIGFGLSGSDIILTQSDTTSTTDDEGEGIERHLTADQEHLLVEELGDLGLIFIDKVEGVGVESVEAFKGGGFVFVFFFLLIFRLVSSLSLSLDSSRESSSTVLGLLGDRLLLGLEESLGSESLILLSDGGRVSQLLFLVQFEVDTADKSLIELKEGGHDRIVNIFGGILHGLVGNKPGDGNTLDIRLVIVTLDGDEDFAKSASILNNLGPFLHEAVDSLSASIDI